MSRQNRSEIQDGGSELAIFFDHVLIDYMGVRYNRGCECNHLLWLGMSQSDGSEIQDEGIARKRRYWLR